MKKCLLVFVAAFVMVGCKTTNPNANYASDVHFSGMTQEVDPISWTVA